MGNTNGEWTVDVNDDETGVLIDFNEVGDEGVSAFTTCMPAKNAIVFATAILNKALELESD